MDHITRTFPAFARIDLAREADFAVGALQVRPSRCEVEAEGVQRSLQRRIMQVLVALAHPETEVVSQDELLRRCWGGLSVSDDAVGRCVAQLRRLADTWPQPPFEIETIPGVGYRLAVRPLAAPAPPAPARSRKSRPNGKWIASVAAGLVVLAVAIWAVFAWRTRLPPPTEPLVEVRAFTTIGTADPSLAPLAARASDAVAGFLGGSGVRLASGSSSGVPAKAQLALDGALSNADGQLRLHLALTDTRTDTAVWAHDFTETPQRADALIDAAKGGALETMHLVREAEGRSASPLDAETLQLAIRGGEILNAPSMLSEEDGVRPYAEAVQRRPDSAALRARYAYALSQLAIQSAPAQRAPLAQQARTEAERVIRDHPGEAGMARLALLALAEAQAPRDWVAAEKRLDAALKAAPDEPFLYGAKCDFLVGVGRATDSWEFCDHALALRPHTAQFLLTKSQALDAEGQFPQVADQNLELGARLYPDFMMLRVYRFARQAFAGSPDEALRLLHDPDTTPPPLAPYAVAEMDALEKARKSGSPADADQALALMRRNEAHVVLSDSRFLFPMALGRLDEAFAATKDLSLLDGDERELLTFAFTAPLRRDPRFWPIAAKAGLTRYWLTTNKWPDFCNDPTYPLDCRAEARRADAQTTPGKT